MSRGTPRTSLGWTLVLSLLFASAASAETKLLRFPDLHGDQAVFSYAGDLWAVSDQGGTARRLTAHEGVELFPKFSPDGRWIAFTGQYDGDEQVYVMPASGGAPRQLTYYPARGPLPARWGSDNQVYGWTPDGKKVLFRSLRYGWSLPEGRLFTVAVEGGLPEPLPMPIAGAGDFSPDGKKLAYSPLFRDFRSWKRYQGGWAQDLQIIDLASLKIEPVTHHVRTDRDPMWIGDQVYFASDRDGTLNIYRYDISSKKTKQITKSEEWDVRWPSKAEDGRIIYELAGELHILDASRGRSRKLDVTVPDDGLAMRPARISVARNIENFGLSKKGERAVFSARGDIFTVPIKKGPTRNLTRTSGAHDKSPDWSPDGSRIVYISDQSGEEQLYLVAQDGKSEPEQLTRGHKAMLLNPLWSPDGKRVAFSDKDGHIFVIEVATRRQVEVGYNKAGQAFDYTWSPKGGYLAFSLGDPNGFSSLYIWSVADNQTRRVTSQDFNEYSPAWDPEGQYLYYLSDRMFQPQIGSFEFNYVLDRETGIFVLALREDVPHPFPAESDEVTVEKAEEDAESEESEVTEAAEEGGDEKPEESSESSEKGAKDEDDYIKIDFEGLGRRVTRVPVADDNYGGLAAVSGHLLYLRGGPFYYGRSSDIRASIRLFSLKDRKESVLVEGVGGGALSGDGKKILVAQGRRFSLYDVRPGGGKSRKNISTGGLAVDRIPAQEWEQIFDEVWRRFRDYFYVPNMHGYDWEGLREQYRPLLKHVAHRSDLNYVISEMIAELSVGHAYIAGGDYTVPARPSAGLPGARFELDASSGRYRIAKIFQGQNEESLYRAPLTEIGVDVTEGDYVLAIDGIDLRASDNPYRLLLHKDSRPISFRVASSADGADAREVEFNPVSSESNLAYLDWVAANRRKVDEMTQGRVGYLHVPDMGANGIREFIKWYYGQIRKEGLVIDVRGNGGGNVSQMLIERLSRKLLRLGYARTSEYPGTYPSVVFHGSLVCLLNEYSASDGDIFPAMFKRAGLGPLIGKRSWGGVIGITNRGQLIDGGSVNVPEFGFASVEGEWVIEGYGVDPDIQVENDPKSVIEGRDPQLERGVAEVLRLMREHPKPLAPRPAPPVKTKSK